MSTGTTDRADANLATAADIYDAFGRGDIPFILERIAVDCRWESWDHNTAQDAGISYLRPRIGPGGVAEFFVAAAELEIHDFAIRGLLASGARVAAEIVMDASTPSGGRFRDEELHMWTFDDSGQVVALRHYVDTAKHIAAWAGQDTRR